MLKFNIESSFVIANIYCKYYVYDISKPLFITFGARNSFIKKIDIKDSPNPWGYEYIKKKGLNVISFVSIDEDCWYRNEKFHNFIKKLSTEISIFPLKLGYGGSMGSLWCIYLFKCIKFNEDIIILSSFYYEKNISTL